MKKKHHLAPRSRAFHYFLALNATSLLASTLNPILAHARAVHPSQSEDQLDSDGDGLKDRLERHTGTDPYDADTDDDGVKDGDEDKNHDGAHDPGESNPRRTGLFPGTAPHIPEPLAFDLVRGLGARKDEVEVNNLAMVDLKTGVVHWAPEVEWAFADGYAVELELPMLGRELESVKVALQGTLPSPWSAFTHGWQTFAEVALDDAATDAVLLYIFGQRFAKKWSYLTMWGGNVGLTQQGYESVAGLVNASLFVDIREWQTWGLETNTEVKDTGNWKVRALPQAHFQLSQRLRLQLGAGIEVHDRELAPIAATRLILE